MNSWLARLSHHVIPHRNPQPDHAADDPRDRHSTTSAFAAFGNLIQPDDPEDDAEQGGDDHAPRRHADDAQYE